MVSSPMQSDEQLYEIIAKELAHSPRKGLLIKCMAKCEGDENKGKALYIETRVDEIKTELKEKAQRKAREEAETLAKLKEERLREMKAEQEKADAPLWLILSIIALLFLIGLIVIKSQ